MISISVDLQYLDEDKAVFHVTRTPFFGISAVALAGLMAAELRKEHGEEGSHWFAKLAPYATTEGSTWKDRRMGTVLDRGLQEDWVKEEFVVRFWKESDGLFKKQEDGSYLVSMADLTKGVAKPQSVRVRHQK